MPVGGPVKRGPAAERFGRIFTNSISYETKKSQQKKFFLRRSNPPGQGVL